MSEETVPVPVEPDEGATGRGFRIWCARFAVEQAETRLGSEATTLAAHETRATAILGWLSAEALGAIALLTQKHSRPFLITAGAFFVVALVAAFVAARVFQAKDWYIAGTNVQWLLDQDDDPAEVHILEAIAEEYAEHIAHNEAVLGRTVWSVRIGWRLFLTVPIVTAAAATIAFSGWV